MSCYRLARLDEGLQAARCETKRASKHSKGWSLVAFGCTAKGDYAGAFAAFDKALELDGKSYTALLGSTYLYAACPDRKLRDRFKAVERCKRLAEAWPATGARTAIPALVVYAECEQFAEGLNVAKSVLQDTPKASPFRGVCERLAASLAKKEAPKFAMKDFTAVLLTVELPTTLTPFTKP